MQILVRSLSGKTIAVELGEKPTIRDLRSFVATRENYVQDDLHLSCEGKGKTLCGEKTLAECGITNGCVINATAKLLGGCNGEELDELNAALEKLKDAMKKWNE